MEGGKAQEKITVVWKCFTWSLVELLTTKKSRSVEVILRKTDNKNKNYYMCTLKNTITERNLPFHLLFVFQ